MRGGHSAVIYSGMPTPDNNMGCQASLLVWADIGATSNIPGSCHALEHSAQY